VGALFVAALVIGAASRTIAQGTPRIWSGVFSAGQIQRGKETFEANCARCHQATLAGSDRGPALKGDNFWLHWENETLNTLFIKVRDNMPPILSANGLPAGNGELKPVADALDDIQILKKGAGATIPNFALVRIVGCLSKDANNAWVLTRTSTPIATTQPVPPPGEEVADKPLGEEALLLTSIKLYKPETQEGHKVEARGLIYKAPGDARLDLTSLRSVASHCAS
jgi:hypothetical protein